MSRLSAEKPRLKRKFYFCKFFRVFNLSDSIGKLNIRRDGKDNLKLRRIENNDCT